MATLACGSCGHLSRGGSRGPAPSGLVGGGSAGQGKAVWKQQGLRVIHSEPFFLSSLQASVPKFDKVPWPSEASLLNKPLVLSIPRRSPRSLGAFLPASRKDGDLSAVFRVPDVLSKDRKTQILLHTKPLCSTCQEIHTMQLRPVRIPDGLALSFKNVGNHRTMSLHQSQTAACSKPSHDAIPTESLHYRLPMLGPRTAVFHSLLSAAYQALQNVQQPALLRKEPTVNTVRVNRSERKRVHLADL
ncbi:uncharacterized protein C1orf105 homolog [Ochotona curzoniae]|uniref:uncharacterized protein C1orf105 homolog n=1 Tax=Ochotona curzoniae TaxID=130825 RepID=UPI001B35153C|nr:uncharacterized protein C1orf105 homolog [Ochotona curzoniae]